MVSATQMGVWIDVGWAGQGVFLGAVTVQKEMMGLGQCGDLGHLGKPIGCHFKAWPRHWLGNWNILTGMWGKINIICGQGLLTRLDIGGECEKSLYGLT